jgi:hypothetical protein
MDSGTMGYEIGRVVGGILVLIVIGYIIKRVIASRKG